ncbi:MAG: EamA family transporter [Nitrospirota bacterium]|nr:EamA family transporter [Nitrospirota bacterium]
MHQRRLVWLGLTVTIAMDTMAQLCWKYAVEQVPDTIGLWETVAYILPQPFFQAALLLFFLQFFNWMIVLANADLSYAQPITALSYVTVSGASMMLFNERLSPLRLIGLALIMLGVWFISRSSHRTAGVVPGRGEAPFQPEALQ